jgi:hypothetical protein
MSNNPVYNGWFPDHGKLWDLEVLIIPSYPGYANQTRFQPAAGQHPENTVPGIFQGLNKQNMMIANNSATVTGKSIQLTFPSKLCKEYESPNSLWR